MRESVHSLVSPLAWPLLYVPVFPCQILAFRHSSQGKCQNILPWLPSLEGRVCPVLRWPRHEGRASCQGGSSAAGLSHWGGQGLHVEKPPCGCSQQLGSLSQRHLSTSSDLYPAGNTRCAARDYEWFPNNELLGHIF